MYAAKGSMGEIMHWLISSSVGQVHLSHTAKCYTCDYRPETYSNDVLIFPPDLLLLFI